MPDQLDVARLAEHARQLNDLAVKARAAYQQRLVDDGARLGLQRDQAARAKYAADHEIDAAKIQSKRELAAAAQADKAANQLEQKASRRDRPWLTEDEELREQAAEQRAAADVARQRAHAADLEVQRLETTARDQQKQVEALEAQMKSTDHMKAVENEIDNLEWHARNAQDTLDAARKVQALDTQTAEATARGDTALASKLSEEAGLQRLIASATGSVRADGSFPVDAAKLAEIGIVVPPDYNQVPGFTPTPDANQPSSMNESDQGDDAPQAGDATAAGTGSPVTDPTFDAATSADAVTDTSTDARPAKAPTSTDADPVLGTPTDDPVVGAGTSTETDQTAGADPAPVSDDGLTTGEAGVPADATAGVQDSVGDDVIGAASVESTTGGDEVVTSMPAESGVSADDNLVAPDVTGVSDHASAANAELGAAIPEVRDVADASFDSPQPSSESISEPEPQFADDGDFAAAG